MVIFIRGLVTFSALALTSCSDIAIFSPRAPTDLHVENVRVIPFQEAKVESLPVSTYAFIGRANDKPIERPRQIIQVSISSYENWLEFLGQHNQTGYKALSCRTWQKNEKYNSQVRKREGSIRDEPLGNQTNDFIYQIEFSGIPILHKPETMKRFNALPEAEKSKRPFVYQLYFDIKNNPHNDEHSAGEPPFVYDLQKNPEDMCLQIFSDGMYRNDTASNVVTIPKEAISAALKASNN